MRPVKFEHIKLPIATLCCKLNIDCRGIIKNITPKFLIIHNLLQITNDGISLPKTVIEMASNQARRASVGYACAE